MRLRVLSPLPNASRALEGGEIRTVKRVYPVEGILDCQACRRQGEVSTFLEAKDMVKHASTGHGRLTVHCRSCERKFPGLNNLRSHLRYCTGAPAVEQGEFPCRAPGCCRRFQTKNGLSQHERKTHTNLEIQLQGEKLINQMMSPYFPDKTGRQIRSKLLDKTRVLARKERAVARRLADEIPYREVEQQIIELDQTNDVFKPGVNIDLENEQESKAWKESLAASAVRTFHKHKNSMRRDLFDIGSRLITIAQKIRESPEVANEMLEIWTQSSTKQRS